MPAKAKQRNIIIFRNVKNSKKVYDMQIYFYFCIRRTHFYFNIILKYGN